MNDDYRRGRLDGLSEAAEIVRDLERTVARRLERPAGRITREARKVRHKAFQVGARRIETVLRKAVRTSTRGSRLPSALRELGLDG